MWLYHFSFLDCHPGLGFIKNFPDLCFFYTDLIGLATKYDVPELRVEIIVHFKSECTDYAKQNASQDKTGSWYLPPLRYLFADPGPAAPLRDILIASFRKDAHRWPSLIYDDKRAFWKEMQTCPDLAWHLLATGGLTGKACKLFQEGEVPQLEVSTLQVITPFEEVIPVEENTPVEKSTPGKQIMPVKTVPAEKLPN